MSYIHLVMALSWGQLLRYLIDALTGWKKRPLASINDLEEVYFPGNHGDIGGGWEPTPEGLFLSDVSFRWMLAQAVKFGVRFQKVRFVNGLLIFLLCPVFSLSPRSFITHQEMP